MVGLYFSGTGNTKYCLNEFWKALDRPGELCPIESSRAARLLAANDEIVLAYPVQYSNLPKLVRDFLKTNAAAWRGKKVFLIATMGAFSGDGTGVAARLLRRSGARVTGGLHLKMPDSIGDVKALKRSQEECRALVREAGKKARHAAEDWAQGRPPHDGLGFFSHLAGLFGQRLYFSGKTKSYTDRLKIDPEACIGCGKCASDCPMQNIVLENGKASAKGRCTMCYRCVSYCPQKAVTLLGKRVFEQSRIENYL